MTDERVMRSIGETFARCAADLDLDTWREMYAPDARIWHNTENNEMTVDENFEFLGYALSTATTKRWYADMKLTPTPTGYISQHDFCAILTSGEEVRFPICMVITLDGDRITRLEEYFDGEAVVPMMALLGAAS